MNKIIFVFVFLMMVIVKFGYAQWPSVVFDPKAVEEAVRNGTMLKTLVEENKEISNMHQAYKDLRKSVNWVNKLRSVKMAIDLLENTVCTSRNLEFSMQQAGVIDNCMFQFKYYNALMQLASAADILNLILSDMEQSPESRVSNSKDAMDLMNEAHEQLGELTAMLEKQNNEENWEKEYKKGVYDFISLNKSR
jgi:hypothetical protein